MVRTKLSFLWNFATTNFRCKITRISFKDVYSNVCNVEKNEQFQKVLFKIEGFSILDSKLLMVKVIQELNALSEVVYRL